MSIDFQQVRAQVTKLGESAPERYRQFESGLAEARRALSDSAGQETLLQERVQAAAALNSGLRSAVPTAERIDARFPLPQTDGPATLLAADGSQIFPDRHGSVLYSLINVGAIAHRTDSPAAPALRVESRLLYDEQLYTETGRITERLVALMRDLGERELLADLADGLEPPVLTLTDGPLELWDARDGGESQKAFEEHFQKYLDALNRLHAAGAATAGYIDKPGGDLLVRLLEIAQLPVHELNQAGRKRPYLGLTDIDLLARTIGPGERSAIFGIRSATSGKYREALALHFFYLNVGAAPDGSPYLARVEVPAWVAEDPAMIDRLHAALIAQCRALGSRPYPYLLHRSHEVALVTQEEKEQVETMIAVELRRRGIPVGFASNKSRLKLHR